MVNATDLIGRLDNKTLSAKNPSNLQAQYYGHEVEKILNIIEIVFSNVTNGTYKSMEYLTKSGVSVLGNVLTHFQPWIETPLVSSFGLY